MGLFSVLDALTDTPMADAVAQLPLTEPMRNALTDHSGPGRLLDCVLAIERDDFEQADTIVPHAGEHYLESLTWTNATAKQLIG